MAKTELKLEKRRPHADGSHNIQVSVGYNTDIYINTNIRAKVEEWDDKSKLFTGANAKKVNALLDTIITNVKAKIIDLRAQGLFNRLSKSDLKKFLTAVDATSTIRKQSVGDMFRRVIEIKNERTSQLFKETLKKLEKFCDIYNTFFESITPLWLTSFDASMKNLSINARAIHLRNLRNVFNIAIDEEITNNYPFRRYRIRTESTQMRVLSVKEMRDLYKLSELERYYCLHRDMFMLSFFLIGMNLVDMSRLTEKNIVDGRIEYRRAKTNKFYSIKIEPEARKILEKYKGEKHLISVFDNYRNYKDYLEVVDRALKKIGKVRHSRSGKIMRANYRYPVMTPLNEKLTMYWARYSWATYAAELDIPKDTISEALGHSYGSRVTGVYIKFNRDKIDKANRQVIDYLLNKKGAE